jgi:hypothetical protein
MCVQATARFRTNQNPVEQCAHVRVAQALAVDSMCVVLEVTPVENVIIIVVSKHSHAAARCGSCDLTCTDARGVCSNPRKHAVFVQDLGRRVNTFVLTTPNACNIGRETDEDQLRMPVIEERKHVRTSCEYMK